MLIALLDGQTTLSFPRKLAAGNASNSPQRGRSQGTVEVKEEDNKAEDHIRQSSMDALWPGALPPGDRSTKAAPASFRSLLSPQPIQLGKTPSTTNASALPQNSALITAPEPNANLLPTEEFRKRPLEEAVAEPSEDDPSLPPWAELDPSWLLGLPEDQRLRILKVYAWRKHQQTGAGSSAQSSLYGDQYPQTLHASHSRSKKARTEFKTQPTLRQAWKNVEPNHATGGSGGSPLYNPSSVQRTLKQTWQRKGTTPTGADSELPDPGPSSSGASHGQQLDWTVLNELPEGD
ncbi:hypothetical protein BC832DRAFT_67599 [Gaertneriomyces semiglobifer]|nr:hypothetical protein BC832DRAFT_67599 [Gaertneriomyces semiglobifer]